jgi:hypothetical protein
MEGHMVQAGAALVESLTMIGMMLVQTHEQGRIRPVQDDRIARAPVVRLDEGSGQPQHACVPGLTRLDIGHGQADVVDPS